MLFVSMGCGKDVPHKGDDELKAYIPKFESAARAVNKPVTIGKIEMKLVDSLDAFGTGFVGYCKVEPGKTPKILILRSAWATLSETRKEVLMFHELGHCQLQRGHVQIVDPMSGMPLSMMYSGGTRDETYTTYKDYYHYELYWNPARLPIHSESTAEYLCSNG